MKTGFWLRGGKGKLAGATVYQQNGETVMREVVTPNNPKTEKQNVQRVIMHTVMQAYSKLKAITDHSFEGQKKGQATMAYFMKQNVQFAREKVAAMQNQGLSFADMYNFVPLGLKGFTPNQYQISMGSLPPVDVAFPGEDIADYTQILVPGITQAAPTYRNIIDAYGLKRGDQLTFMLIKTLGTSGNDNAVFGQNEFVYCRVILDPTNADYTQASLDTPFLAQDGSINLPSVRNENTSEFNFAAAADAFTCLHFGSKKAGNAAAGCIIVSRKIGDDWCRSTTYLQYREGMSLVYSLGDCLGLAASGAANSIYASDEQYLNNAGEGGGQAAQGSSESGSGSSSTPSNTVSVTSVSLDGVALTRGTTYVKNAAELPANLTISANVANAPAGTDIWVQQGSVYSEDGGNLSAVADGTANLSNSFAAGTYYLFIVRDDYHAATGYSFTVQQESAGGGQDEDQD